MSVIGDGGGLGMEIAGLGPHGERAVPAERMVLTEADQAALKARPHTVAVVLHTTSSDWSKQELAGMVSVLGQHSAAVVEVVDCGFDPERQIAALERFAREPVDAVISIPIGSARVADAHRALGRSGRKLVLLDNVPAGMLPGEDYASVVSTDNFGLGQHCAEMLATHVPHGGKAGILAFGTDFFATHERELAFRKWMATARPDITLVRERFNDPDGAGPAALALVAREPGLAGLFAVWDVPAIKAATALATAGHFIPMTTADLGNEVALDLARHGMIKGVGAQLPYEQGRSAARVLLLALLGHAVPAWVALPGRPVTAQDVLEGYQVVWQVPAPPPIIDAWRQRGDGTTR